MQFDRNASIDSDAVHQTDENLLDEVNPFHGHTPLFPKFGVNDYIGSHGILSSSIEAEVNIHEAHNREITPDSPIVQVHFDSIPNQSVSFKFSFAFVD